MELGRVSLSSIDMPCTSHPRILIVDDEPLIRDCIRATIEDAGYCAVEAGNADEAIKLLEDDGIAAVLTDIVLPRGIDGVVLAWLIRTRWPTLPVVVMSGRRLPRPEELPANTQILTKPFSSARLIGLVRALHVVGGI
jgi:DNA-binding response OmpR family regulator